MVVVKYAMGPLIKRLPMANGAAAAHGYIGS
jgi:hypothetical protein